MIKKKFLSLLRVITVVFVISVLMSGCKLFFNNNQDSNNNVEPEKTEKEKTNKEEIVFDIQINLNPQMLEHGAVPSDGNNFKSRSTTIVPDTTTIESLTVTATRKKNESGTEIASADQTEEAGNIITATANTSPQNFFLKINKTGTWLIEVSFTMSSITYEGSETIKLTEEKPYKKDVPVYAYATGFTSINASSTGNVNLVTEYAENLIAGSPSIVPQVAKMKLRKRNLSTGEDDGSSYIIDGIINSTARTVTFQREIPSGLYFAEIAFFADTEQKVPLYVCSETIIVADDKTTNAWVISSSFLERSSGEVLKYLENGPLQAIDNEVKFKITSGMVEAFAKKYEGLEYYVGGKNASDLNNGSKQYPFATVQKAVDTILDVNDKQSQYTILLKSDVVENQNTASYGADRNCSYVNITGTETEASQTKIKITSDSESLSYYNSNNSIQKEGFSIDANRDDSHTGAVIWAENVILDLENVTVRGGYNESADNIHNPCAAGVFLKSAAQVTIAKNTCIENNTQVRGTYNKQTGAGVGIWENCKFIMNGGVIRNNVNLLEWQSGGGVLVYKDAEFIMNPLKDEEGNEITCAIYGNRGMAGAIIVYSSGVFTMNGGVIGKPSSEVGQAADASHWGNKAEKMTSAGGKGGAIFLMPTETRAPTVHLNGGEICYNYAEVNGGAISCRNVKSTYSCIVELNGTDICYNSAGPDSDSGLGGAIYSESSEINMYKGQIYGNRAGAAGGAFYLKAYIQEFSSQPENNITFDPDVKKLNLNIFGGRITDNLVKNSKPDTTTGVKARGGAIYLGANSVCQINGGMIDQNKTYASNFTSGESYGGAIYMETMFDGAFSSYDSASTDNLKLYAPRLTVNGGFINANECGAASSNAKMIGSAISTIPGRCTIKNSNAISSNNDVCDSTMVFVEGMEVTTEILNNVTNENVFAVAYLPITVNDFLICDHEVTQAEFNAIMGVNPSNFQGDSNLPATGENQENRPVEKVSWYDAIVYCNKLSIAEGLEPYYSAENSSYQPISNWAGLTYSSDTTWGIRNYSVTENTENNGYRLATSAEWQYAGREGKKYKTEGGKYLSKDGYGERTLSGGSLSINDISWNDGNSDSKTHEVRIDKTDGTYAGNALGLYDMIGNVYEWVWNSSDSYHYIHGGSYQHNGTDITERATGATSSRDNIDRGFRVVRNVPSSSTTQKYIVTFDTTTNWPGNTNKVSPQIITAGGTVTAPSLSDPTPIAAGEQKHGTFLGWYTKPIPQQNPASGSSTPIDSPFVFAGNTNATNVNSNITLYAVWDFVYVPSATFEGNEILCKDVTNKESGVFIKDRVLPIGNLWVCDHEVTQGEYSKYCKYSGTGPGSSLGSGNNYPAYYVSWYDALVYCNLRSKDEGLTPVYKIKKNGGAAGELTTDPARWVAIAYTGNGDTLRYGGPLSNNSDWNAVVCDWDANGYRLPTEAEWEYIARGGSGLSGTQYVYSGSDDIDKVAWNPVGNGNNITHEVRKKQANSLGLYDMSGNVWEWCWDLRNTLDSNTPAIGPDVSSQNPPERIRRGGSSKSSDTVNYCRVNYRTSSTHNLYIPNLGFRVVRNADGSAPYEPPKYTVTFDTTTNWSSNNLTVAPVQVYEGKKIARPSETPSDNTVNFRGWFTKPDPSTTDTPFDFNSTAIYRDLTLYAVWDFVYVPGAVFNSSTTLCAEQTNKESAVFIAGRLVPIDSLYVCDHEVTQGEWEQYMSNYATLESSTGPNYPAYYMNWFETLMYCNLRSEAEGLTPVYYLVDENGNEVTNGRNVSTWLDSVLSGSNIKQNSGKYYYDSVSVTTNNSKLDYTGEGDPDGGIRFDTNANGYRLPTIAEWEYLARGGNLTDNGQTLYSGSDTLNNVAWVSSNSSSYVHTVKMKQKNALGLYDMSGNVFELCWDRKGTINTSTPVTGPLTTEYNHYALGGCWDQDNTYAYVNYTQSYERTLTRFSNRGFRVVRNASSHTCLVKFDTTTNWPGNTRRVSSQIIDAGDTAVAPATTNPAPTAADAMHGNFLGWYTKPKPSQNPANPNAVQITPIDSPFDFNTPITSDITLYAVWDFVYVTGATFDSSQTLCDGDSDRQSAVFIGGQEITINSLYVCDHEVTQGEYEKYCCYTYDNTYKPSENGGLGSDYPVYFVNWYDAIVYCNLRSIAEGLTPCYSLGGSTTTTDWEGIKTVTEGGNTKYACSFTGSTASWNNIECDWNANGYRLPTSAEWEYAARGGNLTSTGQTIYCGTNGTDDDPLGNYAWYQENSGGKTHPVKGKLPNALNLYDMTGNVSELCWDWHPANTSFKIARSCGFSEAHTLNLVGSLGPQSVYNYIGFRVVRKAQ